MNVKISESDIALRKVFVSSGTVDDYMDFETLRLFPKNDVHSYENLIFEDLVAICLRGDKKVKIEIKNCEFKKGVFIRSGKNDNDYSIFIFKSNILDNLSLNSYEARNNISVDTCEAEQVNITGRSDVISIYGSQIETLLVENEKCELFRIEKSKINKYSLLKFDALEVVYDTDDLAISNYNRFLGETKERKKQSSEIYHRLALKSAKSINSIRKINYQLTKITSSRYLGFFFGYFYKPLYVFLFMIGIVFIYSVIYKFSLNLSYLKSLHFSAYTFLTIGYGDVTNIDSLLKTVLIFSEGLLGVVYSAALLTSIINSSKR